MSVKRAIIAELLRSGRPDLANVVAHGRVVTADAKDLTDAADRLLGPFVKTVQSRADRVMEVILDWEDRGEFNSRKIKLALTKLIQEHEKITKLGAPSNLRPREKEHFEQTLKGKGLVVKSLQDDHKKLGKLNHHDMKATKFFIDNLKRSVQYAVDRMAASVEDIKEWASMLVPKEFKLGKFDVIDDYGIHERVAEPWFSGIIRAAKILEKAGFGYLLYGELHLALDKDWGGMYYRKSDRIDLYLTGAKRSNPGLLADTLIHELGHRLWFKFMDAGQRDQFSAPWIDQDEMLRDIAKTVGDVFALKKAELKKGFEAASSSDFDFGSFQRWLSKNPQKELAWVAHLMRCYDPTADAKQFAVDYEGLNQEAFDNTRKRLFFWRDSLAQYEAERDERGVQRANGYLEKDRRYLEEQWLDESKTLQLSHQNLMKVFEPGRLDMQAPYAKPVQKALELEPVTPSVTKYGQTNRQEDFAEVFEEVLTGRERSHEVMVRLNRALPRGSSVLSQVTADVAQLYHTTSLKNLLSIVRQQKLSPRSVGAGFVSFGERPYFGDISHNEAVLVFDRKAISDAMKVEYSERWFDRYPDHGAYIAGEGWHEQYEPPQECFEYDEEEDWEEEDEECLQQAYRNAEIDAFMAKSDEREWISKREHQPVKFRPEHITGVLLKKGSAEAMEKELWKLGLNHVEVRKI